MCEPLCISPHGGDGDRFINVGDRRVPRSFLSGMDKNLCFCSGLFIFNDDSLGSNNGIVMVDLFTCFDGQIYLMCPPRDWFVDT